MPHWTSTPTLARTREGRTSLALALALPALLLWVPPGGLLIPTPVTAGLTVRVNVASTGVPAAEGGGGVSLSADGRFVVFGSISSLVPGDTNGNDDIFVHDRDADADGVFDEPGAIATRRVGVFINGRASISADGRMVAFVTTALSGNDAVFVHDRDTDGDGVFDEPGARATYPVSVSSTGVQGNGYSYAPSLSADGRFVAFVSEATNMVPGDTNDAHDVFVRDRDTDGDGVFDEPGAKATVRVSVASTGAQGNMSSGGEFHGFYIQAPSVSADGRFVAFRSEATNLVPGDTNGVSDVFVHDRDADSDGVFDEPGARVTRRVSLSSTGVQANDSSFNPSLSADGRVVAFASNAPNLVPGDTNDAPDMFVHDRDADGDGVFDEPGARATHRVSVSSTGVQGNFYSDGPSVSADGRFVAFDSEASNLVHGDTNNQGDAFVHDRLGSVEAVCAGFAATLLGTPGPDHLVGGAGPDVIHGREGNDILAGGAGEDLLCGGDGEDTLRGGAGKDRLVGGAGNDHLVGGADNDRLFGRGGNDQLFGGSGHDWLVGDEGADRLFGENGRDRLVGGPGDDLLDGGDGQDRCEGGEDTTGDSVVACETVVDIP